MKALPNAQFTQLYGMTERVHAVVVPAAGRTVTLEELRGFCADRIAGYKTPRSVELVDALPLYRGVH